MCVHTFVLDWLLESERLQNCIVNFTMHSIYPTSANDLNAAKEKFVTYRSKIQQNKHFCVFDTNSYIHELVQANVITYMCKKQLSIRIIKMRLYEKRERHKPCENLKMAKTNIEKMRRK